MTQTSNAAIIQQLNDEFRQHPDRGIIRITPGVSAMNYTTEEILGAIANFNQFTIENDPYKEHDFGSVELPRGGCVLFKIDYFDEDLKFHSPNPADPAVTRRVMTILTPEEY